MMENTIPVTMYRSKLRFKLKDYSLVGFKTFICPVCGEEFEAEEEFDKIPGCSLTCSKYCDDLSEGKYVL
jgi:hypothetical protein